MKYLTKIKTILEKEYTPLEKGLLIVVSFLFGIVLGFYFSPVKHGITMFSHNGHHNGCQSETEQDSTED